MKWTVPRISAKISLLRSDAPERYNTREMPSADLILKNAVLRTLDPGQPSTGLVVVKGEYVRLLADKEELGHLKGAGTKVIDCQGGTVVPGFHDAHCHVFSFIRKLLGIDLSPGVVSSIADIKAEIRNRVLKTSKGTWLSGTDYNEFYLREKRHPTRHDLDEVAPEHPVVLAHRSLHACVLNSLALKLAGITAAFPEPPGTLLDREPGTGEPSGLLFEMLGHIRERVLPPLTEAEKLEGLRLANEHYLDQGITSLQDASVSNDFDRWLAFGQFKRSGRLKSRVVMLFGAGELLQIIESGLGPGAGDSELRLGAAKMILNEVTGKLTPSPSELRRRALGVHQAGFQLAIHAVEENAVAAAADALEYVRDRLPRPGRRHRIEHASECPPRLIERLKNLETVIVTQPPFLYYSGERYLATVAKPKLPGLYPFGSLLKGGLVLAGSSDSPVVADSPLVGIYAAVTRRAESGRVISPGERISAAEALAMYTAGAAFSAFEEDVKGTISPGKLADLVLLSGDPLKVPPERIREIRVAMTIIGGRVVWEA